MEQGTSEGMGGGSAPPPPDPAGAPGGPTPGADAGNSGPPGSSPIQRPSPNLGAQAQGMAFVAVAVRLLAMSAPSMDPSTPMGSAVYKCIKDLTKHMPTGAASPGVEKMALMALLMKQKQDAPAQQMQPPGAAKGNALAALGAQGGGTPPGGAPPAPTM